MRRFFVCSIYLFLHLEGSWAQHYTPANMPDTIFSGPQGSFHCQGIAVDKKRGYIYFSFTDKLLKTDMGGNIIGSVTGLVGHLGDLTFDPQSNTIYGSLEYKNDAIGTAITKKLGLKTRKGVDFYIAMFDGSRIVKPNMNAGEEGVLKTVYLKEVVDDYNALVKKGDRVVPHKFGCSGIDGLTLGPSIGQIKAHRRYLYVAYGIYGDITRNDNDNQVILKYNINNWKQIGKRLEQDNPHHSGPAKPLAKYFIKTGNTTYGIQNLEYDKHTGNFFVAVYKGAKHQFPNYSLFVIDGHKKPDNVQISFGNSLVAEKSLSLLEAGLSDTKTGIRGWNFKWGSTGLFPLGDGYFYISHPGKTNSGEQTATIYKYKWVGSAHQSFILAN